jgi:hypothetical protein
MSRTINNYRLFCNTENTYVTVWNTDTPSVCPHNNQDHIDTNSITIIDSINSTSVNISQTNGDVNDNYRTESRRIFIPAGQTITTDISYPYNISVLTINWTTTNDNTGDLLNCYVAPNTVIGVITQKVNQGDTILYVSPTVIKNLQKGYQVNLTNGQQTIDLGECILIDTVTNTIKVTLPVNNSMNVGSYVRITVHNVKNWIFGPADQVRLANKHLQTSYLPAGTVVRIVYQNNTNIDKMFFNFIEFLY